MTVQCEITEESAVLRKLEISVEPERVAAAFDAEYAQLKRTVRLKGFRPGKAPRQLLERHFGDRVRGQVLSALMSEALEEALGQHEIPAVGVSDVEPGDYSKGQSFSFTANVEVRPKIEKVDYLGLEITPAEAVVTDEDVAAQINRLRESMAQLRTVEGRDTVEEGDVLLLDIVTTADGEPLEQGKREDIEHQVGSPGLPQPVAKALVGAKLGQPVVVEDIVDDDAPSEVLRGKKLEYTVMPKEIREKILPELDDEFAKDLGQSETLAELQDKIRADLTTHRERRAREATHEQIREQLIARNELQVPGTMIQRRAEEVTQNTIQGLRMQGIEPEQLGLDPEKLLEEAKPRAERDVKAALLLDAVGEAEKVAASTDEVDARIEEIAESAQQPVAKVRGELGREGQLEALKYQLREEKILAFLVERANIIPSEAKEADSGEKEQKKGE
ncbi:MAG: trigger factor [bacterium]